MFISQVSWETELQAILMKDKALSQGLLGEKALSHSPGRQNFKLI